jgi:hypothetical protein
MASRHSGTLARPRARALSGPLERAWVIDLGYSWPPSKIRVGFSARL